MSIKERRAAIARFAQSVSFLWRLRSCGGENKLACNGHRPRRRHHSQRYADLCKGWRRVRSQLLCYNGDGSVFRRHLSNGNGKPRRLAFGIRHRVHGRFELVRKARIQLHRFRIEKPRICAGYGSDQYDSSVRRQFQSADSPDQGWFELQNLLIVFRGREEARPCAGLLLTNAGALSTRAIPAATVPIQALSKLKDICRSMPAQFERDMINPTIRTEVEGKRPLVSQLQ